MIKVGGALRAWGLFALVFWPLLDLLVVYWRCPCAGRHCSGQVNLDTPKANF
jgi:hypothetical protein